MLAYERLNQSEEELVKKDKYQLGCYHPIDRKNYLLKQQLAKKGLRLLGLYQNDQFNTETILSKYDDSLDTFIDWTRSQNDVIEKVLRIKVDGRSIDEQPMTVVRNFVKRVGLDLSINYIKQVKGDNGKKIRKRYYSVDMVDLEWKRRFTQLRG